MVAVETPKCAAWERLAVTELSALEGLATPPEKKKVKALPSLPRHQSLRPVFRVLPAATAHTYINTENTRGEDSLQCSPLITSLLGLFVTRTAYHKSKKSPERNRVRRSWRLVQACGSTAQVYSVQNNTINSPKKILKVISVSRIPFLSF